MLKPMLGSKFSGNGRGLAGDFTVISVASTSATRFAETSARGSRMNSIESIKKANTTCMAYCIKAIMSPTWMVDCATSCAPTHKIKIIKPFRTSIIIGIITTKTRLTNRLRSVSWRFARSNRADSTCWRLKARTTIMPVRFSRKIRLSWSSNSWMSLNFGITMLKTTPMTPNKMITASAIVHHMEGLLSKAWMIAPMPMMGA